MAKPNRVIIFTEGGDGIGYGHITRCSALYDEIISCGLEALIVVYGHNIDNMLKEKKYLNIDWKDERILNGIIKKDDYTIIDSYLAPLYIYKLISENTKKCMYIDDTNRLEYPNGFIVNPALDTDINYPNNRLILKGKDYIILRKEFLEGIIDTKSVQKEFDFLITLGGTDVRALTPKILKYLQDKNNNMKICIVVSKASDDIEKIKKDNNENIFIKYNIDACEMKNLILKSNIIISGAGQSIYELLMLRSIFIPILIIENQLDNYNALIKLGIFDEILCWNDKNFFKHLEKFLNHSKKENKKVIIDGFGVKRIIDMLLEGFSFFPASKEDKKSIYDLSNKDYVREMSLNNRNISMEEHEKWFSSTLRNKNIDFFVIKNNYNQLLGQARFNIIQKNIAEISISLDEKIKGTGKGTFILKRSMDFFLSKFPQIFKIIAYIKRENISSIKIFEKNNFIFLNNEENIYKFEYICNRGE